MLRPLNPPNPDAAGAGAVLPNGDAVAANGFVAGGDPPPNALPNADDVVVGAPPNGLAPNALEVATPAEDAAPKGLAVEDEVTPKGLAAMGAEAAGAAVVLLAGAAEPHENPVDAAPPNGLKEGPLVG